MNNRSLPVLISVFFFWGFVAASNTILIPIFKKHFELLQWQSQLVDFAFYIAYFFGSLFFFFYSNAFGDPLNKIGYKKGLIIGLIISACGALAFVPAASAQSYPLMLTALFIIALGFTLQQIVANPYVIALGHPSTGAHRVNLAGGINSFGTMIGPLLLSIAIFGSIAPADSSALSLESVKLPYVILSAAFIGFAFILGLSKLPPIAQDKSDEEVHVSGSALKYPQLILGMIAIFVYVGVEVTIQSNMPALIESRYTLSLDHSKSVHFISLYWGSLMIGRWTGALTIFNFKKRTRLWLTFFIPLLAFAVILAVNSIKLHAAGEAQKMQDLYAYFPYILILILGFYLAGERPARTMILFGLMAAAMMVVGLMTTGKIALYSFMSGGLFCSVMWPCIFSLAIAGLGKYTTQGSSMLIMMVLGGALIPPMQGYIADLTNIHISYIIPTLCFLYLAYFGWKVKHSLKKQGIDYDAAFTASK